VQSFKKQFFLLYYKQQGTLTSKTLKKEVIMKPYQEKNCMELMEDHHPGRLPIKTVRIPKLVHDLIHQGERDAVSEIFEKDGLKGNPGRWTAKRIPEPVEDFEPNPLKLNPLHRHVFSEEESRKSMEKFIWEMEEKARAKEEEKNRAILKIMEKVVTESRKSSSPALPNYALPEPTPLNQASFNCGPTSNPLFVLGGKEDIEALMRRKIWEENDFYEKTAPSGYEGGPIYFTPGTGWIKTHLKEVESQIPRDFACGDFITTFAEKSETTSGLPTIKFKQPKWY